MPNLMEYLPDYWHENLEMQQIMNQDSDEVTLATTYIKSLVLFTFISVAPESSISRWENSLNISPQGTLGERRAYILSLFRGAGKLNETQIKWIVMSISNSLCQVVFENSTIKIRVVTPEDTTLFENIERTLKPLIPAHIGLSITIHNAIWDDIKTDMLNWKEVKGLGKWSNVYTYFEEG